jgi:23S rRNA (pseudouridine1915-N3)-methyltransferase
VTGVQTCALPIFDDFCARIKHYLPFDVRVIPDGKKSRSPEQSRQQEGEEILKNLRPGDRLVLLDEHGPEMTSLQFAAYLERKMNSGLKSLVFVIGGPFGFSQKVREAAQETLSLSQMTFSHQLIRLIFAEQLYRALTIWQGEAYHHA